MMESLSEAGFHLEILASAGLLLEKKEQNSNCSPDPILFHGKDYHDAQLSPTIKARARYKPVERSPGLSSTVSLSINWERHLLHITFFWIHFLICKMQGPKVVSTVLSNSNICNETKLS